MKKELALSLAVATLAFTSSGTVQAGADKKNKERCYGVAKKGQNDCAANDHKCQGHSIKDGDPTEWVYMPKGLCSKIVGGKLKG